MAARKTPEHAFEYGASKTERLAQIERILKTSKQDLMLLGKAPTYDGMAIPTGSISLDVELGTGGWPVARVVEIFGPEAGGKTTMTLHAAANVQRMGGIAAFVDAEHALNFSYAEDLGCDLNEMIIKQPDNGEQALTVVEELVPQVNLIVVDSVAALVPKSELEGNMGDATMGVQARLMSQALRKLTGLVGRSQCTVIFINQTRDKIGGYGGKATSGGNALKFYASIRCEIRRIGDVKEGETVVGQRNRVKVLKNKLAPPFREAEFDLIFGKGVARANECLDLAQPLGAITTSGSWYYYGNAEVLGPKLQHLAGERIGQGRAHATHVVGGNPDLMDRIRDVALGPLRARLEERSQKTKKGK
jgi:recombination protein RecA